MDSQPSINVPDEANLNTVLLAGYLPSTKEYSTEIRQYPGNNAHAPWGSHGIFNFEIKFYENGLQVASAHSPTCDEKGFLHMDLGAVAEQCGHPMKGMFVIEFHHTKDIPVELYAFHIHKSTGTYVSCNVSPFIGDILYPTVHSDQMENTIFWPGLVAGTDNETHIVVVNPYDVSMGFQVHLIGDGGVRERTKIQHLKAKYGEEFPLAGFFPDLEEKIRATNGKLALCISAQYKLVAYVMFKNRGSQIMSMVDHLHTFCLA